MPIPRQFPVHLTSLVAALALAACAHRAGDPPSNGTATPSQAEVTETEVSAFLDAWHDAAARADADGYFERIAPTGVFLGTDPDERWDRAAFRAAYGGHFARGKAWTFRAFARHVTLAADGQTAWFDERLRSENYGEMRGTGVLARAPDAGRGPWRVALYDLTIPIPNALAKAVVGEIRAAAAPATLTYLGVAGWRFDAAGHTLLVDPYVSRRDVDLTSAAPLEPDRAAIAAHTPAAVDAILVGHSHYDHVLDVPAIAAATGAVVVGTASTHHVATAGAIPEAQIREVQGGEDLVLGPFAVHVLRALHSLTGQPDVAIPAGIHLPMPASAYGEGGTLQYLVRVGALSVLFIGTANFVERELVGVHPDIAVVAVGLREKIPDYTCRLMRLLGQPRLVFANHFDALWEPLGPHQMDLSDDARARLAAFADEVHTCSPQTTVIVPEHLKANPL